MNSRVIYSLCEESEIALEPYKRAGYKTIAIDLKRGKDVRLIKYDSLLPARGVFAMPPCDHLAGSGARWWAEKGEEALLEALAVVDACLRIISLVKPAWWVLENPVGRLKDYLGPPAMYFNPCDYGEPYTKKTCLWGNFTPPTSLLLGQDRSVEPTEGSKMHLKYGGKSERTKTLRSTTPRGWAQAFFEVNP